MGDDQLSDPNLDRIYQEIKKCTRWQEKHSGEGTGTTHDQLNKRVSKTEMRVYGFGLLVALVIAKWKMIFGD